MSHTPKSPLISIIIVSYNTKSATLKSVASALASEGFGPHELEVIVVDNGSHDGTVTALKKAYPAVKLIVSPENLGFGGGNNRGVEAARGTYLLLLNSDAFLARDTLRRLVDVLSQDQELLTVGPRLTYASGALQPSAGYLPTPGRVARWLLGTDILISKIPLLKTRVKMYHQRPGAWYQADRSPEWLMGACILLRRDDYLAVGGFDPGIFMYAEEVELYMRLRRHFPHRPLARYLADTAVIHLGGESSGSAKAVRLTHEFAGLIYLYRRHYPHLLWYIRGIIRIGVVLRVIALAAFPARRADRTEYQKYLGQT
jgi:GT2 family glycosyltransferase